MRTATTPAARAQDRGRWASTNTRRASSARATTATPTTADEAEMRTI
jgi:hypothetical protein